MDRSMFCPKCNVAYGHKSDCPDAPQEYPLRDEAEDVVDAAERVLRFGDNPVFREELRKTVKRFNEKKNGLGDAEAARRSENDEKGDPRC